MHHGLFIPPFGELADPSYLGDLARRAEEAGWEGFFLWDHLVFPGVDEVLDPWIALAAAAVATSTIRLGPMVTPLPRRRPWTLARQVAALDQLSSGRFTLGAGLGDLRGSEFATFGEELDPPTRGRILDESLSVVERLLAGDPVEHHGARYHLAATRFLPSARQQPLPVWVAARWPKRAPLQRAASRQGVFVIDVEEPQQIEEMRGLLRRYGVGDPGFDVVVARAAGSDPHPWQAAGVTWFLAQLGPWDLRRSNVDAVVQAGPPHSSSRRQRPDRPGLGRQAKRGGGD
ncbi:MAG TPA: LLM class flavin-dependent oxidoreductase [Candidatus Dormibacteraeota bacterium]